MPDLCEHARLSLLFPRIRHDQAGYKRGTRLLSNRGGWKERTHFSFIQQKKARVQELSNGIGDKMLEHWSAVAEDPRCVGGASYKEHSEATADVI